MNNYKMRLIYILFLIYNKLYNNGNNVVTVNNEVTNLNVELGNNAYIAKKANNTLIKLNITKPQYEYDRMYDLKIM
jgi:hypothetical protein